MTTVDARTASHRPSKPADPVTYVRNLWAGSKRASGSGTSITQLWNAFDADKSMARRQHGRQAGLGGAWYFCVSGQGTVESVEKNRAVLKITDSPRRACLELGMVVDNTVREAVGLKANDFASAQDFNAVSSELNRRVEQDVVVPNQSILKPGTIVDFVGCAKISRDSDFDPLCLIPIRLEVQGPENRDLHSFEDVNAGASQ